MFLLVAFGYNGDDAVTDKLADKVVKNHLQK